MIRCTLGAARHCSRPTLKNVTFRPFLRQAHTSSTPIQSLSNNQVSLASPLASLRTELDDIAPCFNIGAGQIRIINSPSDFYSLLKDRIRNAKHRIFLSTLYIGTTEYELVDTLRYALRNNPKLRVSILLDALRGTREAPEPSSASLLAPLVEEFGPDRVDIRMFHTPNLTGWKKKLIPKRLNEGWGLQHMKLYGFDDEIIISGANLSKDYFTNRQDRYHLFTNRQITDYYESIQLAICKLSYKVESVDSKQQYVLVWPEDNVGPEPTLLPFEFKKAATELLRPLITNTTRAMSQSPTDTVIYPLAQFTPLFEPHDYSTEMRGLCTVLEMLRNSNAATSAWTFTAGYFNIHPKLKDLLLASRSENGTIITASPEANGFYGSTGISGNLPPAYTLLSKRFLQAALKSGKQSSIIMKEWKRGVFGQPDRWTYHAKGVWINLQHEQSPSITLIGSSNYTRRSYSLDLEMNALIITENPELKDRLQEEIRTLDQYSHPIQLEDLNRQDRGVGWRVRFLLWLFEKQL